MQENKRSTVIKTKSIREVFTRWLVITRGMHKLTPGEIEFMSLLLTKRHDLSSKINDDELINEYLFSTKSKKEYKQTLNFKEDSRIPNLINQLKKKKALVNDGINPAYIPNLSQDFTKFEIEFIIVLDQVKDE